MGTQDHDEHALFREAMGDVTPMEQDRVAPQQRKPPPKPRPRVRDEDPDAEREGAGDAPEFIEFRRPGIQLRLFHDLQRGLLPAEADLDLHGMRRADAALALRRFIDHAQQRGLRVVRVVHGKGRGSSEAGPILKNLCYRWLTVRDEVQAMVTTPRWDGGSGASYVLLRRASRSGRQLPDQ